MRVTRSLNEHSNNVTRKDNNFCLHCGKRLSNNDKGHSRNVGLIDDDSDPFPLCVDSAYIYASIFIKEKGAAIFE